MWDNAGAESWFASYKNELIHPGTWPTLARLRTATFDYIEVFYNRHAAILHSADSARPLRTHPSSRRYPGALTNPSVKPGQTQLAPYLASPLGWRRALQ